MDGERSRQVHAGSLWNRVGPTNRVRNRFQCPRPSQPYVGELGVAISKRRRGVYTLRHHRREERRLLTVQMNEFSLLSLGECVALRRCQNAHHGARLVFQADAGNVDVKARELTIGGAGHHHGYTSWRRCGSWHGD